MHDHDDHDHDDDHDPSHAHSPPQKDHDTGPMSAYEVLEEAVRSLLIEKGVITAQEITAAIDLMDSRSPALGAKVVARAWVDPAFKKRLLADTRTALAELGIDIGTLADFRTVENTPQVHNVIVCTLCSCYPIALLGPSPTWYKSEAYRARVVRDPRWVLADFGTSLPEDVHITVWDASAETRYMVLPRRPDAAGATEKQLAALVTRNGLIGTAIPVAPAKPAGARRRKAA